MSAITAWAICDSDGGRQEPTPLVRCIFGCEAYAIERRNRMFDDVKEHYPIRRVLVQILDFNEP